MILNLLFTRKKRSSFFLFFLFEVASSGKWQFLFSVCCCRCRLHNSRIICNKSTDSDTVAHSTHLFIKYGENKNYREKNLFQFSPLFSRCPEAEKPNSTPSNEQQMINAFLCVFSRFCAFFFVGAFFQSFGQSSIYTSDFAALQQFVWRLFSSGFEPAN